MNSREACLKFGFALLAFLLLFNFASPVHAQVPPNPPDPGAAWNPPDVGGQGGMMSYTTGGGSSSGFNVWLTDRNMQGKDTFYPQDMIYMWVSTPAGAGAGRVWLYEYYPPVPSIGHWLFWAVNVGSGIFIFGPFYPDNQQPTGRYAWRVWVLDVATGNWQDRVIWFMYPVPEFPSWGSSIVAVLSIAFAAVVIRKKRR